MTSVVTITPSFDSNDKNEGGITSYFYCTIVAKLCFPSSNKPKRLRSEILLLPSWLRCLVGTKALASSYLKYLRTCTSSMVFNFARNVNKKAERLLPRGRKPSSLSHVWQLLHCFLPSCKHRQTCKFPVSPHMHSILHTF